MDRTPKGQNRTSGKVVVDKDGILRACCKEVQQSWTESDSKMYVRLYTVSQKKGDTILLSISLLNIDQFS